MRMSQLTPVSTSETPCGRFLPLIRSSRTGGCARLCGWHHTPMAPSTPAWRSVRYWARHRPDSAAKGVAYGDTWTGRGWSRTGGADAGLLRPTQSAPAVDAIIRMAEVRRVLDMWSSLG